MSKLFLDPKTPISVCKEESCENCDVANLITCHFNMGQLLRFMLFFLPLFIVAGMGIYYYKAVLLIPWIILIIAFFLFIEVRVMCSHCPHYAEPTITSLKCWANYGAPKLWKYRPTPMSFWEKFVFLSGFIVLAGYPFVVILLSKNYLLLFVFILLLLIAFFALRLFYCNHCFNFACPSNRVDPTIQQKFIQKLKK